jgi:3-oxoadipate enol-lactonase
MIGVLDDACVENAVVAGLSMGAAVSVALALDHPDRVVGLFIADNSRPDGHDRATAAAERIIRLGMDGLADVYEPILFGEAYRSTHPDDIEEWRQQLAGRDAEDLATIVMAYHDRPDPGPRLSEIRAPGVLVFGEDDAAIPEDRRGDYRPIPHLSEHRIRGAGHISNLEAPDVFNELLLALAETVFGVRRSDPDRVSHSASGPGGS